MTNINNQKNSILSTRSKEFSGATSIRESMTMHVMPLKDSLLAIVGKKYEKEIIDLFSDISKIDLPDLTMDKIEIYGFPKTVARRVFGAVQFAIGLATTSTNTSMQIKSSEDAAEFFMGLQFEKQEQLKVIGLNRKMHVIYEENVFKGSVAATSVCVRQILQNLICNKNGIVGFMIGHCHPSGNPTPSPEDLEFTIYLAEAAEIIGLSLLDHIIVGDGQYVSLAKQGYLT